MVKLFFFLSFVFLEQMDYRTIERHVKKKDAEETQNCFIFLSFIFMEKIDGSTIEMSMDWLLEDI